MLQNKDFWFDADDYDDIWNDDDYDKGHYDKDNHNKDGQLFHFNFGSKIMSFVTHSFFLTEAGYNADAV